MAISALSISGVPPTHDPRRRVERQEVASLRMGGVVEDARRTRMSEETPKSTRIWAQTECWRISDSPPVSVCSPSRSPRFWRMSTCSTASRGGRDQ
ncbi:hypothetical protein PC129_g21483 [Phytophthora cactorum]|uniref:Uncharacterized protein n=1 Tax=Phytophthora cactorum TaxID=29920 RepID=A0A8T1H5G2_9STRA|nr:hypothetical protein PC129_g21483 [Phytophthora cactorum]